MSKETATVRIRGRNCRVLIEADNARLSYDVDTGYFVVDDPVFPSRTASVCDTLDEAQWELFTRMRDVVKRRLYRDKVKGYVHDG